MKSGTRIILTSKSYVINNARVSFDFKTTMTNDPIEVMSRIERSTGEEVIGLEVHYCRHSKKPAILTLSGYVGCLIIQLPNFLDIIPDQLRNLFFDRRKKFVGVNVGRSVVMLKEEYGIIVNRYEDISDIAGGRSLDEFLNPARTRSVSKLMMELMIMRRTPGIEDADWEKSELDDDLVAYASLEAHLSYMIGFYHK